MHQLTITGTSTSTTTSTTSTTTTPSTTPETTVVTTSEGKSKVVVSDFTKYVRICDLKTCLSQCELYELQIEVLYFWTTSG